MSEVEKKTEVPVTEDVTMKSDTTEKRPREEEKKADETTTTTETPAAEVEEPAAKKAKIELTEGMKAIIKKQMEYYLCDDNLKYDKFFQDIIRQNEGGWMKIEHFMNCRKIAALKITEEDIFISLKDSLEVEINEETQSVRRAGGKEPPTLEKRESRSDKKKGGNDDLTAIMIAHNSQSPLLWFSINLKDVKEEPGFAISVKRDLKDAIQAKFGKKNVPETAWTFKTGQFDEIPEEMAIILKRKGFTEINGLNDLEFTIKHKEQEAKVKLVQLENQDVKKKMWELCPPFLKKEHSKNISKNKPKIALPGWDKKVFDNTNHIRTQVKEVLMAHSFGEVIPEDSSDYQFLSCLLKFHPNPAKLNGLKSLVIKPFDNDEKNRCLFLIKEDGTEDNISLVKCIQELQNYTMAKLTATEVKTETVTENKTETTEKKTESTDAPVTEGAEKKVETSVEPSKENTCESNVEKNESAPVVA